MTGPGAAPREPAAGSPAPAAPPLLLEISDLQVHYRAPRQAGLRAGVVRAVDGVTLSVARGVTLGLVGESGSGKTTLAKSLVKLEPVTGGEIRFGGTEIGGLPDRAFLP
ncbi:MAG TPA: ATP-binding cassette domain-containing protein, partial [Streptosporangiaceae bacterium]|nr:ATP-binding cassette domain-containing protein [Streptosporangiaceae bacterium]